MKLNFAYKTLQRIGIQIISNILPMEQYRDKQFTGTNGIVLEQHFTKKGVWMANMFVKKQLQPFIITKTKMIVMRQHFTLNRMEIMVNIKRVKQALSAAAGVRKVALYFQKKNSNFSGC